MRLLKRLERWLGWGWNEPPPRGFVPPTPRYDIEITIVRSGRFYSGAWNSKTFPLNTAAIDRLIARLEKSQMDGHD